MVTKVQSDLIEMLKACGLSKEDTAAELVLLKTDENRQRMIDEIIHRYDEKGEVTEQDIQKIGLALTGDLKPEYKNRILK